MTKTAPIPKCARCGAPLNGSADALCTRCLLMGALTPPPEDPGDGVELETPAMLLERKEFAGYELVSEVARGGMGIVFRARQKRPDRTVALKVIATGELASPATVDRFRTEAEAAARLEHPNIVPVYEVGQHGTWHFFSMRLIEGPTLAQSLDGNPMPPKQAASLMAKIARAVHHAHQRGILHRDLKPNNILLDAQREPHLMDFGLAKLIESSVALTQSDMVMGTPAYMSPEQAMGSTRDVTMSVDIYGLGAVLYEMLTGRPPFQAANMHALLRMIAEQDPQAPSHVNGIRRKSALVRAVKAARAKSKTLIDQSLNASAAENSLFADLDAICLKCLEKNPAQRYSAAEALAEDLERALRSETIVAKPSTRTQRLRRWVRRNPAQTALIVTAALSLGIITVGSLIFSVHVSRARAEAERNAANARRELVSKHLRDAAKLAAEGDAFHGALSLSQAFAGARGDETQQRRIVERLHATFQLSPRLLRLRNVQGIPAKLEFLGSEDLSITLRDGTVRLWNLPTNQLTTLPYQLAVPPLQSQISPDGAWKLELVKGGSALELSSLEGDTNVATYPLAGPLFALHFSPDSRSFSIAAFRDQATVYESVTGKPRHKFTHESGANQALFSPDGTLLVTAGFDYELRIHRSADQQQLMAPAIRHASLIQAVAFSPDSRFLAAGDVDGVVQVWDLKTSARPFLVEGEFLRRAAITRDGKFLVLVGKDSALHVFDVATGEEKGAPMPVPGTLGQVAFDPGGRKLAVACRRAGIRVFDFQTRQLICEIKDISAATEDIINVVFNPDGTAIVTATPRGVGQRWNVADGTALGPEMMRNEETFLTYWSADGKWISAGGGRSVHVWNAATSELLGVPVRVNPGEHIEECEFSPDGKRILIAFSNQSIEPAAARLFELPSLKPAGTPLRHGDGVSDGGFSVDGRLVVTAGEDNTARVWNTEDGSPASPELRHGGIVRSLAFRSDGRVLATGCVDGMLRMWDVERGELIAPPLQLGGAVSSVRLYGESDPAIVSVGTSQTWIIPYNESRAPLDVLQQVAECQSGLRVDTNGGVRTISAAELEGRFTELGRREPSLVAWPENTPRWHLERAAAAERQGDMFAAAFHLQRCEAVNSDSLLRARLERARRSIRSR